MWLVGSTLPLTGSAFQGRSGERQGVLSVVSETRRVEPESHGMGAEIFPKKFLQFCDGMGIVLFVPPFLWRRVILSRSQFQPRLLSGSRSCKNTGR